MATQDHSQVGVGSNYAAEALARLCKSYPEKFELLQRKLASELERARQLGAPGINLEFTVDIDLIAPPLLLANSKLARTESIATLWRYIAELLEVQVQQGLGELGNALIVMTTIEQPRVILSISGPLLPIGLKHEELWYCAKRQV